ncbi:MULTISPECIES: aspartate/glutamate racemase family protein [unclassified Isoptericola]|uniref:aspartate/glutamate racemase family protein n=1 Tax=unclassified Isoptericola TaxID=2623355 RepID=UPI002712E0FB|nr:MULTISPECIES: amino acid racemase [unclassified Isoptericola]MDO8148755.1 amino acid racemase [Isoptericola sp. b515]MDO8151304.1 amino acid racemase [Isoptericola sp. b408]
MSTTSDAGATGPMPPVGVIGGVGPLATAYFLQRVVQLTDAARDQEHVDLVVLNHATIPDRTDFVLGRSTDDPGPVLARDAARLEAFGVRFLVMPCNTAHYFTQQVLDAVTVPFVSIVDVTVTAARARVPDLTRVGLLATAGTVASRVYDHAFAAHGIDVVAPDEADQERVNAVIYEQVKAGRPADPDALRQVAARLVDRGAGVVVLGCTELSVAAVDHGLLDEPPFLDSMDELVRATITRAGHRVR